MKYDYYELLSAIYNNGHQLETRGLKTLELNGVNLVVDSYNFFASPGHRAFEDVFKYLKGELCWYLSGERSIEKILPYSKFWGNIRNADNTINSNYGDLVFYRKNSCGLTSFNYALLELKKDKNTRKGIVLYNDREFFYGENKDFICNQYQHFLIRNNELICFVALRSSDAIMGLQYNIPWWSLVQQFMHMRLISSYPELKIGKIEAFISSSHIYENKLNLVEKILESPREKFFIKWNNKLILNQTFEYYMHNLEQFYEIK